MRKALIKKQILELYKGFFVSQKKGTARSAMGKIGYVVLYFLLIVVVLGGAFFGLSMGLGAVILEAGMDWLYFALVAMIALVLGVFTGALTTYSTVYQAKDNDLLLSLPIPTGYILTARLSSVYLMGLLFTAVVEVPAIVVYTLLAEPNASVIVAAVLQMLCVSVLVLALSCLLGWVVAEISRHLKNKNIVKVLASLLFLGGYYVVYFRAMHNFQAIIAQIAVWGQGIKSTSPLYILGAAAGNWKATGILIAVSAAAWALTRYLMAKSFLTLAATNNVSVRRNVKEARKIKVGNTTSALLKKELARFTSNANYMLNCGLGTILLPAAAAFAFLKRETLLQMSAVFTKQEDALAVLVCAGIVMVMSMNDLCAASVSLEGKSIWISQSMPVQPRQVLKAKLSVQIISTLPPAVICAAICAVAMGFSTMQTVLIVALIAVDAILFAMVGLALNLKMPNLTWTNELYPIKQSGCVAIALFAPWGYAAIMGVGYLLFGYSLGVEFYMMCFLAASAIAVILLRKWLRGRGSKIFQKL